MRNAAGLVFAALCSCAPSWALASGREGEQYVPVVLGIVAVVLIAFVGSMIAGVAAGAVKARRNGESALNGGARGVLKGLWYFLIVIALLIALATFLGFVWIVFAFGSILLFPPTKTG